MRQSLLVMIRAALLPLVLTGCETYSDSQGIGDYIFDDTGLDMEVRLEILGTEPKRDDYELIFEASSYNRGGIALEDPSYEIYILDEAYWPYVCDLLNYPCETPIYKSGILRECDPIEPNQVCRSEVEVQVQESTYGKLSAGESFFFIWSQNKTSGFEEDYANNTYCLEL